MKLFSSAMIIILALTANAQNPNAPVTADEEETGQTVAGQTAVMPGPAAPQTSVSATNGAALAKDGADAAPAPAKDPAKCVIARFGFDGNLQPDVGGGATIPVIFKRESAAYLEGVPMSENSPRFVQGRFGKSVLIESAYANLFSIAQAGAADTAVFTPLQAAVLSISSALPWQGKESLAVATPGENCEEGFYAEATVEKVLYTKESAPAIAPAFYLASLYLKGHGNVKLMLKDVASGACGETVYIELTDSWQRFSCGFGYAFDRINIGANHEADWKNSLPPGTGIDAKLQLICITVDSQKLNFFADGLQLEQRFSVSGKNAEFSPHSWVLGAFQTAQEQLTIDVKNDYFNTWKKTGSIAFWFNPLWEARDNSGELILQIAKNQLNLFHNRQKIIFLPAGVSFTPYDWKNNWHHLALVWNEAGERILYVDGMDYPNAAGETRPIKDAESIMAGDFTKNLSPNGALDELTLYNITLTPEQVRTLAVAAPAAEPNDAKSAGQSPGPAGAVSSKQQTASEQPPALVAQDDEMEEEAEDE